MWPTLYEVDGTYGTIGLHTYGLFALLAFVGGVLTVHLRARSSGLSVERLPAAYLLAALGGFTGAKILYAIGTRDVSALFTLTGGIAWYGGIVGGGLAVLAGSRALGLDPWKLADATAPGIMVGAALGRTGCFFAGCCHGGPIVGTGAGTPMLAPGTLHGQLLRYDHFPWLGAIFDGGAARFTGIPVYPTQVWQAVGSVAILFVLLAVARFKRFDGQVAAAWLITEPMLRIVVETFRGDHRGFVVAWPAADAPSWLPSTSLADGIGAGAFVGVTTSQAIGLAMIAAGVALTAARWHAGVAAVELQPGGDPLIDDLADGA